MTKLWSLVTDHQLLIPSPHNPRLSRITLLILCGGYILLLGCPTDNAPLKQENLQLKKQVAKLESVVFSLQEGNKVTQQQIDLLNREARKAQEQYEQDLKDAHERLQQLSQSHKQEDSQSHVLEKENTKLRGDAQWLRTQRDQMRKGLKVEQNDGKAKKVEHPFLSVVNVTKATLARNGYTIRASMQTDEKAVFITGRKTSHPTSLEFAGFRNQYILSVEKQSAGDTRIWVKADFEKLSQRDKLLNASKNELNEIESRLIQEIQQTLSNDVPSQKPAGHK